MTLGTAPSRTLLIGISALGLAALGVSLLLTRPGHIRTPHDAAPHTVNRATSSQATPDPPNMSPSTDRGLPSASPPKTQPSSGVSPITIHTPHAPAPTPANSATPDLAVLGGVLAWELSDTKLDKGPNDTAERAQDWLTPTLVRQVTSFYATKSPGAAWSTWTRHHAWLRVALTLTNDDHRPDTTTTAVRQLLVQIAPTGRDSWTGTPSEHVDAVLLERTPAGWRLASLFSR